MPFYYQSEISDTIMYHNGSRDEKVSCRKSSWMIFFPIGELPGLDAVPLFMPGCYCRTVTTKKEKAAYNPFVSLFYETALALLTSLILQGPDNSELHS
jgi:hypothetical protein